jgi:hypothetical protein
MAEALGTLHALKGAASRVMMFSRPKVNFDQNSATVTEIIVV